jgi:hypothetical protein
VSVLDTRNIWPKSKKETPTNSKYFARKDQEQLETICGRVHVLTREEHLETFCGGVYVLGRDSPIVKHYS